MITINLLPAEMRRAERTSPKIFITTLVGVILVCCSLGWFGYVYFGRLGNLEVEERAVAEDLANKKKQAGYYDELVAERKEFEKRSKTIQTIGQSRMLWTQIFDQLIDVVNNDGDTDRHLGWFRNIHVKASDSDNIGPTVTMPGWVQGDSMKKVADFHEDLEHAKFFGDVVSKGPPSGVVEINNRRQPSEAMFFNLKWSFKPPKDWEKNASAKKDNNAK